MSARLEDWLEAERDQLVLWAPVMLGAGIAAWFGLPDATHWRGALLALLGIALAGLASARGGRAARLVTVAALLAAMGLALAWWRAERVAAPVLAQPVVVRIDGLVERVEPLPARAAVRLTLVSAPGTGLPPRVRVNLDAADLPRIVAGDRVRLAARLMPPAAPAVPGAYDFARQAWFAGIGATGRGFGTVTVIESGARRESLRSALTAHITGHLPGSAGGIAAALATGDEGAIGTDDAEAMRRAGLAHLLSVSGLHITAAVAATMLVVMRLLALWPWLALRVRLPLVAAAAGALAAIGYTVLTGSQVPTIRSCVAALLVIGAIAMGREAVTLRLVAAGALVVLACWPEALVGPSFQLSFAAIVAIVALHDHGGIAPLFAEREEPWWRRRLRGLAGLLLTGVVVEVALMPIAVFHFHKAGLYGAVANLVAIPLTTFVVMPLEVLALALDLIGLGAPIWWLIGRALAGLLWLAHAVSALPGSSLAVATVSQAAFGLCIVGGLWLALWRTRWRWLGAAPLIVGCGWMVAGGAPDVLVSRDGRHVAVRVGGGVALLRDRTGDYMRGVLSETSGEDAAPVALSNQREALCSRDACRVTLHRAGRAWQVVATRSGYTLPWSQLAAACRTADIVISERRLPRGCTPRWLKLDAPLLRQTGGIAIALDPARVTTVRQPGDRHPWLRPPTAMPIAAVRYRSDAASPPRRRPQS